MVWNSNIPLVGNQLANDWPDINENFTHLKDFLNNIVNNWDSTTATNMFIANTKRTALTSADSPYTMLNTDVLMECDTSGGAITINVIAAATLGAGRYFMVKVTDATNTVTIDPNGAETIDGKSTFVISEVNQAYLIYSDGTNLQVLGSYQRPDYGMESRSVFTYNGGATAYTVLVDAGSYMCKDKYCYWSSQLTTDAIGSPAASTWYYLYLDYSAITSNTQITASELIWSTTAPSWNSTYRQWMNGDDRCIFCARTDGTPTNILEFFHSGNEFFFANDLTATSALTPSTTWTDVTFDMPACCRTVIMSVYCSYSNVSASVFWRTNGQTGTTGHYAGRVTAVTTISYTTCRAITDTSQKIEVKIDSAGTNSISIYQHGWVLPLGM